MRGVVEVVLETKPRVPLLNAYSTTFRALIDLL